MAFLTGLVHCLAGYDVTMMLAFFFYSSSYWTKYKAHIKHKLEADFKEGSSENQSFVFASNDFSNIPCFCARRTTKLCTSACK